MILQYTKKDVTPCYTWRDAGAEIEGPLFHMVQAHIHFSRLERDVKWTSSHFKKRVACIHTHAHPGFTFTVLEAPLHLIYFQFFMQCIRLLPEQRSNFCNIAASFSSLGPGEHLGTDHKFQPNSFLITVSSYNCCSYLKDCFWLSCKRIRAIRKLEDQLNW